MYKHARWLAVLLLGLGLLATQADSVQAHGGSRHRMERRFQQRLGLSDDQMKAIREVRQRQAPKALELSHQLRRAQQELRQLALTGDDEAGLAAKAGEVKTLEAQLVDLRVATRREIGQILTPEQRQKLASLKFGWHRRHHHRHHHYRHQESS